eukprot:TRINITY_DN1432_c0_g1_i2.p2 TRINITY_DN1432_c0_g1~~TRINITY_DN1432_c0_g1_i2.p2  ORF type:complete len:187 (-),score=32.29 TRINITY_DN1432_c0_g1_i2:46-606(-)
MNVQQQKRLFNHICTSSRDLNRLSPALRRKHLLALKRRISVPKSSLRMSQELLAPPTGAVCVGCVNSSVLSNRNFAISVPPMISAPSVLSFAQSTPYVSKERSYPASPPHNKIDDLGTLLNQSLEVCSRVIEDYYTMFKEKDFSVEIDTLKRKIEEDNNTLYEESRPPQKKRKLNPSDRTFLNTLN